MAGLIASAWRGTVERVFEATKALPMVGRGQRPVEPADPRTTGERPVGGERGPAPMHDQQHVNPAKRLERGHPKR